MEYKSICILGRQPALGIAELESLYASEHVQRLDSAALLDIPAEEINFQQLGGTIKVARVLTTLNSTDWDHLAKYLTEKVPEHLEHAPSGKFTIGLSIYNLKVSVPQINKITLDIKKIIKKSGRPVRVVPNKSLALNSAQVLHNKLTYQGAWELLLIKKGNQTILAQTLFVQDIEAYANRDQVRPARDPKAGMLPPKLAQIIINLAAGPIRRKIKDSWDSGDGFGRINVLDPFCGTGVILQEALLMGYSVYGTDIEPRMVEYSKKNLQWLVKNHPSIEGKVIVEIADAAKYRWPGFSCIASEVYLGPPLSKLPADAELRHVVRDVNIIIKKFLQNLASQLKPGQSLCIAIPAWRGLNNQFITLPLIDQITDMGYAYWDLKQVRREELIYFREDQIVARQFLRIKKVKHE